MSLVEILVSLVISLFLLAGIIQVFIADKASYSFTESISRIQENGRFSLDTMAQDLRMAGFFGCAIYDPDDTANITNNLDPNGAGYDATLYDFLGMATIEGTDNDGLNGSDTVTIRGAKPGAVNIYPPYNTSTSAQIFVNPNNPLVKESIVMISNCSGADIFQITNMTQDPTADKHSVVHNTGKGSPGNYNPDNCAGGNAHCLSQTYGADASMFELQTVTYSIAVGESGEPALFRSENGVNVELIDGIENMQVLYGIDDDADNYANQFVVASAVTDSLDVVSIRLMLLVRSASPNVTEDVQVYNFNGVTITATDNRLRQVFSTSIALRNRAGI